MSEKKSLFEEEIIQDKCGLCLAHTLHDAYSFIKSLQHRGREACGIAAIGDRIDVIKWIGDVSKVDLIDLHKIFPGHNYKVFLAHVRYATKGREDKILEDSHPHVIGGITENKGDHIIIKNCDAVAVHNGQVNFEESYDLKEYAKEECDTKTLLKYYLDKGEHEILRNIPGSYVLIIADKKRREVIVMRDRAGLKPACLGFKDGKYCVASEDASLKENGAKFIEDLEPGSIYYVNSNGDYRKEKVVEKRLKHCFFEWNYIASVDSMINGLSVLRLREELGRSLAEEFNFNDTEIITFFPRCPEVSARVYARELRKEKCFIPVFYKMRAERAFQGTNQSDRNVSIKKNLNLLPGMEILLKGKTIVCIDDSTIRGTNAKRARELFESVGVKKVYYLNYTPKIGIIGKDNAPRGCSLGVDMPKEDNFIVRGKDGKSNKPDNEISEELGMDVRFLSVEGMFKAFEKLGIKRENLCHFCIGGDWPFK